MTTRAVTEHEKLIERWIEPSPHRAGADEVRIKGCAVSVWAIIGYVSTGDEEELAAIADGFRIPVDAVRAAVAYYERHRAVIDNRLAANRA